MEFMSSSKPADSVGHEITELKPVSRRPETKALIAKKVKRSRPFLTLALLVSKK